MNISISKKTFIAMVLFIAVQQVAIVYLVVSKTEPVVLDKKPPLLSEETLVAASNLEISSETKAQFQNQTAEPFEQVNEGEVEAAPSLSAEQIAVQQYAAMNANTVFDNALVNGEWTRKDTMSFVAHRRNLSAEDLTALHRRFHAAFNAQELNIKHFPPL